MGTIISHNQPCLKCASSDARQIYEDGSSYCFSCNTRFQPKGRLAEHVPKPSPANFKVVTTSQLAAIAGLKSAPISERKLSKRVTEFYGVKLAYSEDGVATHHYYPYDENVYKVRTLPKEFKWIGTSDKLFGQDKFQAGGKRLIICEGEIDALAVAQASLEKYDKIYPVVAIPSASETKRILEHRSWVRSFTEVIICFDEDSAGKTAVEKAIKIVGLDKVKIMKLPEKDACDVYLKHGGTKLYQCIYDAAAPIPKGILTKEDLWEHLIRFNETPSISYPQCLAGVNLKTKGLRLGEITLFISGTGSGKSTLMREIAYHLLQTTPVEEKIGWIALEESPAESARKFVGIALSKNPANEELSETELRKGFDKVFGSDRVIVLDHQGSMSDGTVVEKLEYMALSGCKYLFIDHITIMVSEAIEGLSGNESQDKVMNDLLKLVKRHNVWIGLVSHLRKTPTTGKSFEQGKMPNLDDVKGSGSTKQISMDVIGFARDMTSPKEDVRNIIKMSVLKCRHTGLTGPVHGAKYDFKTGRLVGIDEFGPMDSEDFVSIG